MKIIPPPELNGTNVYFTDADLAAQRRAQLSRRVLDEKIKLLGLLNDHVVVATSHIFESPLTHQVLLKNRELLESGIIVPALRGPCRDFKDFQEQKQLERQLEQKQEAYRSEQSLEVTQFLQARTETAVSWKLLTTREDFKQSLVRDLSVSDSLIREQLDLEDEQYEDLLARVNAIEVMSRANVVRAAQDLPEVTQSKLFHYVDLNYYLAGASAVESDPVIGSLWGVRHIRDKIERACDPPEESDLDIMLFKELLASLDISTTILRGLTDKDIVELRQDQVIKEFRDCYTNIVESVRRSLPEPVEAEDMSLLAEEAKAILGSHVREKLRQELKDEKTAKKVKQAIQISGYVTALISLLSLPLLPPPLQAVAQISGGLGTAVQLADPLLQKILVEPRRGELILFAARMVERTRKYGGTTSTNHEQPSQHQASNLPLGSFHTPSAHLASAAVS